MTSKRPISVVALRVGGEIEAIVAKLLAILEAAVDAAIRTAVNLRFAALICEAVLHREVERAAESVQTENRIIRVDVQAIDGDGRDQIEIGRVAERLVDAYAVLIHGEPLRGSRDARGVEAPVENIGGEIRAVDADRNRGRNMGRDGVRHRRQFLIAEFLSSYRRDEGWNLVFLEAGRARNWRWRNNVDLGKRYEIGDILRLRRMDERDGSKRRPGHK